MFLSGKEVAKHIEGEVKINPNGCDLRISEAYKIPSDAVILLNGKKRGYLVNGTFHEQEKIKTPVRPDENGYYLLEKGVYEVRIANKVNIPKDTLGLLVPRSTFNRLGIIKSETAIWDAGYSGYGTQTVYVPVKRAMIHKDEFWFQFVMVKSESSGDYNGFYQNEKRRNDNEN